MRTIQICALFWTNTKRTKGKFTSSTAKRKGTSVLDMHGRIRPWVAWLLSMALVVGTAACGVNTPLPTSTPTPIPPPAPLDLTVLYTSDTVAYTEPCG